MAAHLLSPLTGGFKPSAIALVISICFGSFFLTTPLLPLSSDIPNYQFPLSNPTLSDLAFSSATVTYFLGVSHLILRFSKPTVSAEGFSIVTLCSACATLILGLLFELTTAFPGLLAMCAGVGQGGGGSLIEGVVNLNRKFGP